MTSIATSRNFAADYTPTSGRFGYPPFVVLSMVVSGAIVG